MNDPVEKREAILLIHGIDGKTAGDVLAKLERGLLTAPDVDQATLLAPGEINGHPVRNLRLHLKNRANPVRYSLMEGFWGDTIDKLTQRSIREQILRGLYLIRFWAKTPVIQARNRYIAVGGVVTALALLLWWYGVVAGVVNVAVLPTGGTLVNELEALAYSSENSLFQFLIYLLSYFTHWGTALAAMLLGGGATLVVDQVVNILHFTERYLSHQNLQARIWRRLTEQLQAMLQSEDFDRLTIVSHSFGTVLHVDLLADWSVKTGIPVRHITLGGPLAVMALRSEAIRERLYRALTNPRVSEHPWTDFYSPRDWLCTATPDGSPDYQFGMSSLRGGRTIEHHQVPFAGKYRDEVRAAFHTRYFQQPSVLSTILEP
ncbi:MAG: hypothetical protein ACFE0O_06300 [Opitutales bacterium]